MNWDKDIQNFFDNECQKLSENKENTQLQRVYITTDDDGHNYVIPFEMVKEFNDLLSKGYKTDDFEEFEAKFGKYATGGDYNLIELWAKL